jgi:hypothetical protein
VVSYFIEQQGERKKTGEGVQGFAWEGGILELKYLGKQANQRKI